ncbi:MAG: glycosyltransferase family 4 protein [Verrucomicrobiota bacterium]
MKILILSNDAFTLCRFRGHLVREMVSKNHRVLACCPPVDKKMIENVRQLGAEYVPMPMNRTGLNPFQDIIYFFRLIHFFYSQKPDILLSYTIKPVIYGSLAAWMTGIQKVFSLIPGLGYAFVGGTMRQKMLAGMVERLYRKALKNNQAVFFQNPDDQNIFIQKKLISSRQAVLLCGSGIPLEEFAFVRPYCTPCSFFLMGRMLADKGFREFIEAARRIKRAHPEIVFKLAGATDENPSSISLAEIQGWVKEGVVEYTGFVEDVRPLLQKTSVFVLPSYYREGVPRSILEALAMGRPIITTDMPGCRETVIHGDNGFLIPPKNIPALQHAMEQFITNPSLIESMGLKSRQLAEQKFNIHYINQSILQTMELT